MTGFPFPQNEEEYDLQREAGVVTRMFDAHPERLAVDKVEWFVPIEVLYEAIVDRRSCLR